MSAPKIQNDKNRTAFLFNKNNKCSYLTVIDDDLLNKKTAIFLPTIHKQENVHENNNNH